MDAIAIVVIGRNEGDRLRRCLDSVMGSARRVVYVDSGSADGSVQLATAKGALVVELDPARPFSAARARNEGFRRVLAEWPETPYVQFVDGDCEVCPGWLDAAADFLEQHADVAAVCGRLRERFPEASVYNRLCQMEWDAGFGEVESCGGIAMMRSACLSEAGGFNDAMIAGEEPELCVRLRLAGWRIWRLACEMALHDAAISRFGQWWKRAVRSGHAYAEGASLHGRPPARHWVRETRSNWFWGLLPAVAAILAWPTRGWSLLLLGGYPVLLGRVFRRVRTKDRTPGDAAWYALFCVIAKFPQVLGQIRFHLRRFAGRSSTLIEYKAPSAPERVARPASRSVIS